MNRELREEGEGRERGIGSPKRGGDAGRASGADSEINSDQMVDIYDRS